MYKPALDTVAGSPRDPDRRPIGKTGRTNSELQLLGLAKNFLDRRWFGQRAAGGKSKSEYHLCISSRISGCDIAAPGYFNSGITSELNHSIWSRVASTSGR